MSDTTFIDEKTVIRASWLNDINRLNYTILNNPANLTEFNATTGLTAIAADVASNTASISTNTANISTNTADISAIESSIDATGARYGEALTANGTALPAYGERVWKDITGTFIEDQAGAGKPSLVAFIGTIKAFAFAVGDKIEFLFHIPHDYAVGTDIFLHAHWGHQGTNISGNLVWDIDATCVKRVDSADVLAGTANYAAFPTPVQTEINSNTHSGTMNITKFPQYCHVVEEVQLSSSTPTAAQLDTADIEVDALILVSVTPGVVPTITGGTTNDPFLFTLDVHYQADIQGTKNKDPDFYS